MAGARNREEGGGIRTMTVVGRLINSAPEKNDHWAVMPDRG